MLYFCSAELSFLDLKSIEHSLVPLSWESIQPRAHFEVFMKIWKADCGSGWEGARIGAIVKEVLSVSKACWGDWDHMKGCYSLVRLVRELQWELAILWSVYRNWQILKSEHLELKLELENL